MEHRRLGTTGVSVSKLCLGAMMFGDWGNGDHDDSVRIIHRALDAGVNFIDTADVYSAGEIIGPRTMQQLDGQLPAAGLTLDAALLDRIDEIVLPGVNINPADGGWVNPAPAPAARRRG